MLTLLIKVFSIDHLQPLGYDGGSDELVGGDFLVQLVIGALVKQNQVVQLVPENFIMRIRGKKPEVRGQYKTGPNLVFPLDHFFFLALPPPPSFFLGVFEGVLASFLGSFLAPMMEPS